METAWFFLKTFSLRMAKQGDLNRFLRTDLSAPAAAPAILPHHRLPVLEAHGPDETTLYADSTTIAGIPHPDFKAFYFLEPRCGLFREKPVKPEIAAAVAAVTDGHELILLLHSQPERVPPQLPRHGNQARVQSLPVVG